MSKDINGEYYMDKIHESAEITFYSTAINFCELLYKCNREGFIPLWEKRIVGEAFYNGWLMGMSNDALNELVGE
jgi:hypothetical protein